MKPTDAGFLWPRRAGAVGAGPPGQVTRGQIGPFVWANLRLRTDPQGRTVSYYKVKRSKVYMIDAKSYPNVVDWLVESGNGSLTVIRREKERYC